MRQVLLVAGILITASAAFATKAAVHIGSGDLAISVDSSVGPGGRRAAELFVRQARERSGVDVRLADRRPPPAMFWHCRLAPAPATQPAGRLEGTDGFRLNTVPATSRRLELSSETPSGFVAGMGELMRLCEYRPGSLLIPQVTEREQPAMPVRGMYFATHFGNFYDAAPLTRSTPSSRTSPCGG